jgi:DNA polymerase-3 subunit alpha (Gram-positive type)
MRLLFVDIETTGFDRRWDSIIEVAAILYNTDLKKQIITFHEYIKPYKKIPEEIEKITGITNAQVENCRGEFEVLKDFIQFIKEYAPDAIVGHNYDAFDGEFFKAKSSFHFLTWPIIKTIDTLKVARQVKAPTTMTTPTGAPSYKQQSIAAGYGLTYQAHSAIEDVKTLIEIYNRMTGTQQRSVKRNLLGF